MGPQGEALEVRTLRSQAASSKSSPTDHVSIDTADTIVKHTAHLVMEIPQDKCDFRPSSIDGVPYYKIWFRARPEWDGLLERWLFMVHRKLLRYQVPIRSPILQCRTDSCRSHGQGNHHGAGRGGELLLGSYTRGRFRCTDNGGQRLGAADTPTYSGGSRSYVATSRTRSGSQREACDSGVLCRAFELVQFSMGFLAMAL